MAVQITASSKGQIVLPKKTRERLGIASGTVLDVIDTPAGIELRLAKTGKAGSVDEALQRLRAAIRYDGPALDEADWQRGIDEAIRAKWGKHDA